MSKEPTIPVEIFEKEIRYKIMAKIYKREELHGSDKVLFEEMKMMKPIAILGVRKPVSLDDFKKQLVILAGEGFIEKTSENLKITKKGIDYAKSQKGESTSFFY